MTDFDDQGGGRPKDRKDHLKKILDTGAPSSASDKDNNIYSASGNCNVVGNGNVVNFGPPKIVKKIYIQPGAGFITAAQKKKINDIFSEWAAVRGLVRKNNAEFKSLRFAFNTAMNVNSYHEIKSEDFEKAIQWLRRQTGIVLSMSSAPNKVPDWRNKRYRAINARAKQFPDGEARYRRYALERFGSGSLKELDDDQLDAVYRHVFGWR